MRVDDDVIEEIVSAFLKDAVLRLNKGYQDKVLLLKIYNKWVNRCNLIPYPVFTAIIQHSSYMSIIEQETSYGKGKTNLEYVKYDFDKVRKLANRYNK